MIGLMSLVLTGCAMGPRPVDVKETKTEEFEIVGINPPKHFYLDLKNVRTGEVHHVYVSKHYNNHRKITIGMKLTLTQTWWNYDDGSVRSRFDNTEIRKELDKL